VSAFALQHKTRH